MIDKSLIYECIQHNNYRFTAGRGVDALYAVIEGMDAQLESAEQMITDYIMKHKNMLRSDRHSYNAFVSSFTSTIELRIEFFSSELCIEAVDICEYHPEHYNFITSLKCSDYHRMLAMMTAGNTGILSSSRLYSIIMRHGVFVDPLGNDLIAAFLQIYDAMLFAMIKNQKENLNGQNQNYAMYKDIANLCSRMEEAYGDEYPLVGCVRQSLETLERNVIDSFAY